MAAASQPVGAELYGVGGSPFSRTLQGITTQKLEELNKKRARFEDRKKTLLTRAATLEDPIEFLEAWSQGVKKCFNVTTDENNRIVLPHYHGSQLEVDLANIDRFIDQARYDPSISPGVRQQWQQTLQRHVDVQSLKYDYAQLYGRLTNEMLAFRKPNTTVESDRDSTETEDYEHVAVSKRLEGRKKWADSVFQPAPVLSADVDRMLNASFDPPGEDQKPLRDALAGIRSEVHDVETSFASEANFDTESLQWVIDGLLGSDLLSDEQREVLRDFQSNDTILTEIADVLNMWISAPEAWTWGREIIVEERRGVDGNFRVFMNQDLLQAMFLRYVGMKWSVSMKHALRDCYARESGVWATLQSRLSSEDRNRREFYTGAAVNYGASVGAERRKLYQDKYFLNLLPENENEIRNSTEGDEEADFEDQVTPDARQGGAFRHRRVIPQFSQLFPADSTPLNRPRKQMKSGRTRQTARKAAVATDTDNDPNNPMHAKQALLHLLSTEILIKTRFHNEITCFRSQFEDLFPRLPHQAILCTLKFFGVTPRWIQFFENFLRAPLRFADEDQSAARVRQRGVPGSQQMSEMLSEVVLFVLDFQVNQATGGEPLWRMNDDFWYWSANPNSCEAAWETVNSFCKTMGLQLNPLRTGGAHMRRNKASGKTLFESLEPSKGLPTGQIRWGMLLLNPETGRFEIDKKMVDKHIQELHRQLKEKSGSMFAWIKAWNTYAATFFTSNFGKPANCFGKEHIDSMLATHERIQREIFSSLMGSTQQPESGSVIEFLKHTIADRFDVTDIPDGYFFFPVELGGLDVRSSFVKLLQIRNTVVQDPTTLLDKFEAEERLDFKQAKERYLRGEVKMPDNAANPNFKPQQPAKFLSFEEFTRYREDVSWEASLHVVYQKLLSSPTPDPVAILENGLIMNALTDLQQRPGFRSQMFDWHSMQPYWKWIIQLYGQEMIERFGELLIVDPGLLPTGMVGLFRNGRVKWQD